MVGVAASTPRRVTRAHGHSPDAPRQAAAAAQSTSNQHPAAGEDPDQEAARSCPYGSSPNPPGGPVVSVRVSMTVVSSLVPKDFTTE